MRVNDLEKCKNCGADLEQSANGTIRCAYCRTVYSIAEPAPVNDIITPATTSSIAPAAEQETNSGAVAVIVFAILAVLIFIALFNDTGQDSASYTDSLAVDTSTLFSRPQPAQLSETEETSLRKLAKINVDQALFEKLYKDSSTYTTHLAMGETYLQDKDSIANKPVSGLYTRIEYNEAGYRIYFSCQHIADKALHINSLTFIANGKRLRYEPSFSMDLLHHKIREYSKELIDDTQIQMLLTLATADKVTIVFNGKKRHDKVVLPKDQQDALKRQLQLYKGLLLGYGKR